jgi:hypothetical protein
MLEIYAALLIPLPSLLHFADTIDCISADFAAFFQLSPRADTSFSRHDLGHARPVFHK